MAQAFSRRPVATEAEVQSQASPCATCVHRVTGTGFYPNISVFSFQYHYTFAPCSFIYLTVTI